MSATLNEALRKALDDAMLAHTGRSIGDLASEHVTAEIMPLIQAEIERVKVAATTYVADVIEQRDAAMEFVRRFGQLEYPAFLDSVWVTEGDAHMRVTRLRAMQGEARALLASAAGEKAVGADE